jgi:hypothetical protein
MRLYVGVHFRATVTYGTVEIFWTSWRTTCIIFSKSLYSVSIKQEKENKIGRTYSTTRKRMMINTHAHKTLFIKPEKKRKFGV